MFLTSLSLSFLFYKIEICRLQILPHRIIVRIKRNNVYLVLSRAPRFRRHPVSVDLDWKMRSIGTFEDRVGVLLRRQFSTK